MLTVLCGACEHGTHYGACCVGENATSGRCGCTARQPELAAPILTTPCLLCHAAEARAEKAEHATEAFKRGNRTLLDERAVLYAEKEKAEARADAFKRSATGAAGAMLKAEAERDAIAAKLAEATGALREIADIPHPIDGSPQLVIWCPLCEGFLPHADDCPSLIAAAALKRVE